jgi:putative ATP-dependent endonuclease of OLD family
MYLSELKIWNFRKYGIKGDSIEKSDPGISIKFHEGMNVLIGENDSGKTTIIDAIKYTLGTQSGEFIRFDESDFHVEVGKRAQELRIECIFRGFTDKEAAGFLEWIGTEEGTQQNILTVRLTARNKGYRIFSDIKAGQDPIGISLEGDARALLRTTYLKPLRDADAELTPGRRSRFAQILKSHPLFQKKDDTDHELETIFNAANLAIEEYFKCKDDGTGATGLMKELNAYVDAFFPQNASHRPSVTISGGDLFDILQRLTLSLDVNPSGLGAANLLFMATELLLLQSDRNNGLKLALIEELEAHLHPQAQLRLIRYLEERSKYGQYILTTHSTTMGSSIPLENLIICKNHMAFPMGIDYTNLSPKNYDFLYRFLDATKANLFFAKGVLLVEGDAENLLIPTIAKIIDRPLHRYGVSIVNVGSTAFDHFVEIFNRKNGELMGINVSLITDMDVKPLEYPPEPGKTRTPDSIKVDIEEKTKKISALGNAEVKGFVSPNWTLEYEIALSPFREDFYRSLLCAKKIIDSKTGEPQESKTGEVNTKVQSDFQTWQTTWNADARKNQKIAFEIYKKTMLDKDVSKAVTAQVFAQLLNEKFKDPSKVESLKSNLQSATSLKYMLDAIYHVTEPRSP